MVGRCHWLSSHSFFTGSDQRPTGQLGKSIASHYASLPLQPIIKENWSDAKNILKDGDYICQSLCSVKTNSLSLALLGIGHVYTKGNILHVVNFNTRKWVWNYHAATAFHIYVRSIDKTHCFWCYLGTQIFWSKSQTNALQIWPIVFIHWMTKMVNSENVS